MKLLIVSDHRNTLLRAVAEPGPDGVKMICLKDSAQGVAFAGDVKTKTALSELTANQPSSFSPNAVLGHDASGPLARPEAPGRFQTPLAL